ncbi:MAG: VIT1/CCC1 transporter family protein, partial [Parachlamydiaceae bacterium]
WLAWVRLERLHRILAQEKWEIEHNRPQEREELRVLYGSKGFEGPLLEQVVDVLMADESRLLKVMVEEEMGITLQNVEHPLKQGFFSFLGAIASLLAVILTLNVSYLSLAIIFIGVAVFSGIAALKAKNSPIDSAVWSIGIAVLSIGLTYFLTRFIFA